MKTAKIVLIIVVLFLLAAAPLKLAFVDVGVPPVDTVEYAGKRNYQQCVYWQADEYTDYAVYLGWYGGADSAPADPLAYCLANFASAQP